MYIQFTCHCLGYNYDIIHKFSCIEGENYSYEKCNIYKISEGDNYSIKVLLGCIQKYFLENNKLKVIEIRNCKCNTYSTIPKIDNFSFYLSERENLYIIKNINLSIWNCQ